MLFRTFLARFFEHESTAGRGDLRESFFWILAALAAPGLLFAFYEQFSWNMVAQGRDGAARLRIHVLFDKTFYLTLTAVAMGLVSAAVWNALVVDRRDALILGTLPVRTRAIVAAKLLSLGAYVGALNLGMHLGVAVLFGTFLGHEDGWVAVARGTGAHLVAATGMGMFVCLAVVAVESVLLAVAGPRRFARMSAALQLLLVAAITALVFLTPAIARGGLAFGGGTGGPVGGPGLPGVGVADATPWLILAPPIWFLGLYETIAGTTPSDVMNDLARTAAMAFGGVALVVAIFYPMACARALAAAVAAGAPASRPWTRRVSSLLVERLSRRLEIRAALQFLIASAGRVGRFRLLLSAAVGLGVSVVVPMAPHWMGQNGPAARSIALLVAPCLLTAAVVAGWRVVVAMPLELSAGWVFQSTPADPFAGRMAVRRLILVSGVVAPLALFVPAWTALWGLFPAALFVTNAMLAGGVLVESHLWGFAGMPCTRQMAISDANLQGRWPFYAAGLLAYAVGLPLVELALAGHPAQALVPMGLIAAYYAVRTASEDAARVNVITDYQRGLLLLDLTAVPPAPARAAAGVEP